MIELKNFKEVWLGFVAGRVPEAILLDCTRVQINIEDDDREPSIQIAKTLYTNFEDTEDNSFMYLTGGNVFICENEDDLKQIEGCDFEFAKNNGDRWPNVTELPMSWDCCDYVDSDESTGWAIFLLCSNNAGGNIYYVPRSLWVAARLEEHMEVHKKLWSSDANNS